MKTLSILLLACFFLFSQCSNQKTASSSTCFKARFEIKAICSNYTFKLLEGNLDTSKIVANWKDETTGKEYTNVFGISNPCSLPKNLNAGDEFYFVLDTARQNCAVCMAYYPTPPRKLSIKVLDKPCN